MRHSCFIHTSFLMSTRPYGHSHRFLKITDPSNSVVKTSLTRMPSVYAYYGDGCFEATEYGKMVKVTSPEGKRENIGPMP